VLRQDQDRRISEVRVLIKEIIRLLADGTYLGAIIGGDLNFEAGSPEYRELEQAGLQDTFMVAAHSDNINSYDPRQNVMAGQGEAEMPSALRDAVGHLPKDQQEKILEGYGEGIGQARRIDFLFVMRTLKQASKGCLKQELFGAPTAVDSRPGSDHYGVLGTYIADPSQC
jgi:endonuclease/exonuclease/phosphatase family metal-dependent hydrolase